MEFFGLFAFVMIIINFDLPDQFKKVKARVKKLDSKKAMGGENVMSEILKELEGKKCTINEESGHSHNCRVLKVDDEWIKVLETDKKGKESTRVLRVENIKEISKIE